MTTDAEDNKPGLILPKWFLYVAAASFAVVSLLITAIGLWAIWATTALFSLQVIARDVERTSKRVDAMEVTQQTHALQLQTISAMRLDSRLDRIEAGVQSLQRDFDRTLGKVKPGDM
mgnify:CR=1 FL=1